MMRTSEVENDNPDALDEMVAQDEVLDETEEEFDGFDGSWDYEWVGAADQIMEEGPWTWIAIVLFVAALVYSYFKNKAK
jgi:hypothetical protein